MTLSVTSLGFLSGLPLSSHLSYLGWWTWQVAPVSLKIASESKMSLLFEIVSTINWPGKWEVAALGPWLVLGTDGWWVKARAMVNWSLLRNSPII